MTGLFVFLAVVAAASLALQVWLVLELGQRDSPPAVVSCPSVNKPLNPQLEQLAARQLAVDHGISQIVKHLNALEQSGRLLLDTCERLEQVQVPVYQGGDSPLEGQLLQLAAKQAAADQSLNIIQGHIAALANVGHRMDRATDSQADEMRLMIDGLKETVAGAQQVIAEQPRAVRARVQAERTERPGRELLRKHIAAKQH